MSTLLSLPDDVLSHVIRFIPAADLWRLEAVCLNFHGKDPGRNREKLLALEVKSYLVHSGTMYHDLYPTIPRIIPKLAPIEKHFLFSLGLREKELWQGFLRYYDPESTATNPMDDLLRKPHGELSDITETLGAEVGTGWKEFERTNLKWAYVLRHFYVSNITNLTKEDLTSDLHVTLVSLIQPAEQPRSQPELRLHYSSQGFESQYPPLSSLNPDSPSIDILRDQKVKKHKRGDDDCATPFFIWKSKTCLHSFSLIYKSVGEDSDVESDSDEDSYERDVREFEAYERRHFGRYNNPRRHATNDDSDHDSEVSESDY